MSEQDVTEATTIQRPTTDDREAWKTYWEALGQLWRTEPEIDAERQKYLAERRRIAPNIEQGIYPFKDVKLTRADVEWLLATHEGGRGPIFWNNDNNRIRLGLDLRGADLRQINLRRLPLAFMRGGLFLDEWLNANEEQRAMAAVLMSGSNLYGVHLERAVLRGARLEGALIQGAYLENVSLRGAHLEGSTLSNAYLNGTAFLDARLSNEKHIGPSVADIHWGDVNLAVVKWSEMEILGDEYTARQKLQEGKLKDQTTRLKEYEVAVRANRQLAVVLQSQGMNEYAARFAYRAQVLQRKVLRLQGIQKFGQYLFSLFLDLLAGYGYRPGRSIAWYFIMIFGFALAYFAFGHLSPLEAFIFSLTSFHGRGFFPGSNISLSDPRVVLAAFEAVVGLLIEISFIATFTQRFFGK